MSAYRYAVKVKRSRLFAGLWTAECDSCGRWLPYICGLREAHFQAARHAATCQALHRANWAAACPSCKSYGRIAPACPVCLGRGYEREREGLS